MKYLAIQSNLNNLRLTADVAIVVYRKLRMSLFLLDSANYPSFQILIPIYRSLSQLLNYPIHLKYLYFDSEDLFLFYYWLTRNLFQIFYQFKSFDIYLFFHHILFRKTHYYHRYSSTEN
jgi:hypothetical protein